MIKWLWDILLEQYLCIVVPFSSFRLFFSPFYIYISPLMIENLIQRGFDYNTLPNNFSMDFFYISGCLVATFLKSKVIREIDAILGKKVLMMFQ